jgi:hypothetical protein
MKKSILALVLVAICALFVSMAGAQGNGRGNNGDNGRRGANVNINGSVIDTILDQTGLTTEELRDALQVEGTTLADVITANGGDVSAVIDEAVASATDTIEQAVADGRLPQARADRLLDNLETRVSDFISGERPLRELRRGAERDQIVEDGIARAILETVADATGLDPQDIIQQVRDGATMADIITANGGDVDTIAADITQLMNDRVNQAVADGNLTPEQADNILQALTDNLIPALNGERPLPDLRDRRRGERGEHAEEARILNTIATAAGITPEEVRTQVEAGATLADILRDNGVDVDAFVSEQIAPFVERQTELVAEGRISQELADARINLRRVQLNDLLARTFANRQNQN